MMTTILEYTFAVHTPSTPQTLNEWNEENTGFTTEHSTKTRQI